MPYAAPALSPAATGMSTEKVAAAPPPGGAGAGAVGVVSADGAESDCELPPQADTNRPQTTKAARARIDH